MSIMRLYLILEIYFIIHPCDPTEVICYLIWSCDMAVHITHLISHSYSLSYHTVIKEYFILGVKFFVDKIRRTSLGFPSRCPENTCATDSCFQGTTCENLMMYGGLYQHIRVLYIYYMFLGCLLFNMSQINGSIKLVVTTRYG